MKTIKIYALPSHQEKHRTHGVDFARVIQPMSALNGYSDGESKFEVELYDIHARKQPDWLTIAEKFDIIFFNYTADPWAFAAMGAMVRHFGKKMVLDLDDSLWNIRPDNPAYNAYQRGGALIRDFSSICGEVDLMTTTSDYLKHVIMNNTRKKAQDIKVIPNYINLDLYSHRSPFKNDGKINLVHFGSTTHFNDLASKEFTEGIDRIMSEYPNATISLIGAFLPRFKKKWGARYNQWFGAEDVYRWIQEKDKFPAYMDKTDILVVPLNEDIYNRCKSPIKFLEASSAGIPGVYQNIRQYREVIEDGVNGLLALKARDWYQSIKRLIDDPTLRQTMGEQAFKSVEAEWQMKDHVAEYAQMFRALLTNQAIKT